MRCRKKFKSWPIFLILSGNLFFFGFIPSNPQWEKLGSGITEPEITAVVVHPQNNSIVFAATGKAVYKSSDGGKNFRQTFLIPGSEGAVNYLYIVPADPKIILVATDSGLFISEDLGEKWQKAFYSIDTLERKCMWVASFGKVVYLATQKGLFYKALTQSRWQKENTLLHNKPVFLLAEGAGSLYLATDSEVFGLDQAQGNLKKIFSLVSHEVNDIGEENETMEGEAAPAAQGQIKSLVAIHNSDGLMVATTKGVFLSDHQGGPWNRLEIDSLPIEKLTSLFATGKTNIWAATKKGVYSYDNGKWQIVYKGLETNVVNFLAQNSEGKLYAATDKGIFVLENESTSLAHAALNLTDIDKLSEKEPTVNDVQNMAIEYAEVSPSKIKLWRRQAQFKALMPEVSLDFDKTVTTALGATYDRTAVGPQDWGVNLKWDIGELIWNSDQTSIDSRSKLMVELREDVLDQVTRLYFERRRLQIELAAAADLDLQLKFDKKMRIDELTALIDGFTGGEFGREIEKKAADSQPSDISHQASDSTYGKSKI